MILSTTLLAISAYIFGSIPTGYLLVKLVSGRDLRQFGSGSVTASNAGRAVGRWATAVIGVVDILKGAVPVWVAQAAGLNLGQQFAVGIAGVIGHNWSVFLGFQGGRGMSALLGVLLAGARVELVLFAMTAILGILLTSNVPLFMLIAVLLIPVWSGTLEQPAVVIAGNAMLAALVLLKRALGEGPPAPDAKGPVLLYRLLFDRDTRRREEWIDRAELLPAPEPAQPTSGG